MVASVTSLTASDLLVASVVLSVAARWALVDAWGPAMHPLERVLCVFGALGLLWSGHEVLRAL